MAREVSSEKKTGKFPRLRISWTLRCSRSRLCRPHRPSAKPRKMQGTRGGEFARRSVSNHRLEAVRRSDPFLQPADAGMERFGPATFSAASDPETGRPYTIEKDGFRVFFYSMVGQYGTHVDPPAHFDPNGQTLDQIPLKQMILPLVVFDLTPILRRSPITRSASRTSRPGNIATAGFRPAPSLPFAPICIRTGRPIRSASNARHFRRGRSKPSIPVRTARNRGERSRIDGYRYDRRPQIRGLVAQTRSLADRGDGQPGQRTCYRRPDSR